MGTCVSITISLFFVLIVFALIGDEFPRVQHEFASLIKSLGVFTAMTVISAGSFYLLLMGHRLRFVAQTGLWTGIFATGWYYWP